MSGTPSTPGASREPWSMRRSPGFLLVVILVLATSAPVTALASFDVTRGERAVLRCESEVTCVLERGGALGSLRPVGTFDRVDLVKAATQCHSVAERRKRKTTYTTVCGVGIWVGHSWTGPTADVTRPADLPTGLVWAPLLAHDHDDGPVRSFAGTVAAHIGRPGAWSASVDATLLRFLPYGARPVVMVVSTLMTATLVGGLLYGLSLNFRRPRRAR